MRVPFIKCGFDNSWVRKLFAHAPATVMDVSWPSFAGDALVFRSGIVIKKLTHIWRDEHPLR